MSTQVRERLSRVDTGSIRVTKLPFGLNAGEGIAALLAVVMLIGVLAYYFASLRPQQDQLGALERSLAEQQKSIISSTRQFAETNDKTPEDQAKDALESLEAFKSRHLKPFSAGRIDLIKEINSLAKKHNVTLTSGIDMGSSLSESKSEDGKAGSQNGTSKRNKADQIFTAFPSVSFHFAVFGQYANLRTFINELEHEKQFLVVDSVNLTNQEARTSSRRARAEGMSGIMLSIEMSAYFQP